MLTFLSAFVFTGNEFFLFFFSDSSCTDLMHQNWTAEGSIHLLHNIFCCLRIFFFPFALVKSRRNKKYLKE